MTTGKGTFNGLAVPIQGESEIKQETAGTDILTVSSVADATAANHLRINVTATSAITSGYLQGAMVNLVLGGGMTGGNTVQANAFATDITLSGTVTGWVSGMYVYMCEGTSAVPAAGFLSGYVAWFAALGSAALLRAGFHAGSEETSTYSATYDGAFVAECASAGAWKSLLVAYGGPPEEFLHITEAAEEGMYSTGTRANVAAAVAYLKVNVAGTIMWITLHASCTS